MGEMKSAWEKAMEKAEKLGKPSDEELKQLEHVPAGNRLAARFIKEEGFDLDSELTKYKGTGIRKYILQGVEEIFLRNINLPRDEHSKQATARATAGIRLLKENKSQLETILERVTNVLNYYEQALQQTYMQFKQNFESKLPEISQALQQRRGPGVSVEAELQQQFQEEWHKISSQLDAQYEKALEEHRQQIAKLA